MVPSRGDGGCGENNAREDGTVPERRLRWPARSITISGSPTSVPTTPRARSSAMVVCGTAFLAWYERQEARPLALADLTPIALVGYRAALQQTGSP